MKWQEVLPVIISMGVIILVAVLQRQSKLIAAVTATMPVTIPLALWIVYSSSQGDQQSVEKFSQSLVFGIIPTAAFVVALWITARLGLKLVPMIVVAYAVWAGILAVVLPAASHQPQVF
jgi:hypothetical protein